MLPKVAPVLPGNTDKDKQAVLGNPLAYAYEQKLDGWRCLAYVENCKVTLATKRGLTHRGFGEIKKYLAALGFEQAIFDGEILCLNGRGQPDFKAMMRRSSTVYYFIFDLLYLNGMDARQLPLLQRKTILLQLLKGSRGLLRYVEHYEAQNAHKLANKIKKGDLEGIIAKLSSAPYDPKLPANWVKLKNQYYSQAQGRWKQFSR